MEKQFFILIGRSGSGKGTQAELLKAYLEQCGAEKVLHITTGGTFRDFMQGSSYAAIRAKSIANSGGLLPEFLAVWNWGTIFISSLTGAESVILDGAPRRLAEVEALHSAISFFGYKKPVVVYIEVSETWAIDKLASRGREDDNEREEQAKKMEWFFKDVLPCVDHYMSDPRYAYVRINGEQSVEEVHKEIIRKIELEGK